MDISDILNTKIDVFKIAKYSGIVNYTTTLRYFLTKLPQKYHEVIEKIRLVNKTDEKLAKEMKKNNLIGCTISATFDKYRRLEHLKEYTGLIAIDIDKDKNTGLNVEKAKQEIIKLPYVALTQLSCRGEGIWCLIPYNKDNDFLGTYNALYEDFKNLGYIIDKCKDATRLRFISYDDNILVKVKEIEVYNKVINIARPEKYRKEHSEDNTTSIEIKDWKLEKEDLKDIATAIYVLVNFNDYHKDDYDEWLLDGFRLATIPNKELGLKLFQMISENSDNYEGEDDVKEKFEECYRTTTYSTSILGYYINLIKDLYGTDWRYRVTDLLKNRRIS